MLRGMLGLDQHVAWTTGTGVADAGLLKHQLELWCYAALDVKDTWAAARCGRGTTSLGRWHLRMMASVHRSKRVIHSACTSNGTGKPG